MRTVPFVNNFTCLKKIFSATNWNSEKMYNNCLQRLPGECLCLSQTLLLTFFSTSKTIRFTIKSLQCSIYVITKIKQFTLVSIIKPVIQDLFPISA